jgi:hypothetical protein
MSPPEGRALRASETNAPAFRPGFALLVATLLACSHASGPDSADASDEPPCVTGLTPTCSATYSPPSFTTIFTNILQPNCAVGMGTCHTPDYAAGGLVFADQMTAYDLLIAPDGGPAGTTPYVIPGDPGCSTLMKRLESTDPNYHMPRGPNSLSAGDLCTIVQWISQGASP